MVLLHFLPRLLSSLQAADLLPSVDFRLRLPSVHTEAQSTNSVPARVSELGSSRGFRVSPQAADDRRVGEVPMLRVRAKSAALQSY